MNAFSKITRLLLLVFLFTFIVQADFSGDEVLTKVDQVLESPATIMNATMTTNDANGNQKFSKMIIYTKKSANGKERVLIEYLAPAVDKGVKFLSLGDVNQIWMYLPKVEKTVRIAGSMIKQSMMNSDFSYEDLMNRSNYSDSYTAKIIGHETIAEASCYILELNAKKGNANYRQIKLWVREDNFIPIKEEFFSGSGSLVKIATQSKLEMMSGRIVPTKITFQDLAQKGHQTTLEINQITFNANIPERYFNMQYLEKGQ
jgi:outer membrane lipoprotein-sorting protein